MDIWKWHCLKNRSDWQERESCKDSKTFVFILESSPCNVLSEKGEMLLLPFQLQIFIWNNWRVSIRQRRENSSEIKKNIWRETPSILSCCNHFQLRFISEIVDWPSRGEKRGTNDKRELERHLPSCLPPPRLRPTQNTDISSDLDPHQEKLFKNLNKLKDRKT